MDNLNIGFLVSSVLAVTGLGVYTYMNNNDSQDEHVNNENITDDNHDEEHDSDHVKSGKKTVTVKTKRRATKNTGTRRKRF